MVYIKNAEVMDAASPDDLLALFEKGNSMRHVGATKMNAESSRSHSIFAILVEVTNNITKRTTVGKLSLVDLAGSERADKTGATGERMKEGQSINKSLSALGDVIMAINNGDSHVPYRNSKLTWLLQPCLGNQSKALMFVNVDPSQESAQETLCSLRFASKVNACEIGTAKRFVS